VGGGGEGPRGGSASCCPRGPAPTRPTATKPCSPRRRRRAMPRSSPSCARRGRRSERAEEDGRRGRGAPRLRTRPRAAAAAGRGVRDRGGRRRTSRR
jgi:hypothetical protein